MKAFNYAPEIKSMIDEWLLISITTVLKSRIKNFNDTKTKANNQSFFFFDDAMHEVDENSDSGNKGYGEEKPDDFVFIKDSLKSKRRDRNFQLEIFLQQNSTPYFLEKWVFKTAKSDKSDYKQKINDQRFIAFLRTLTSLTRILPCYAIFLKKEIQDKLQYKLSINQSFEEIFSNNHEKEESLSDFRLATMLNNGEKLDLTIKYLNEISTLFKEISLQNLSAKKLMPTNHNYPNKVLKGEIRRLSEGQIHKEKHVVFDLSEESIKGKELESTTEETKRLKHRLSDCVLTSMKKYKSTEDEKNVFNNSFEKVTVYKKEKQVKSYNTPKEEGRTDSSVLGFFSFLGGATNKNKIENAKKSHPNTTKNLVQVFNSQSGASQSKLNASQNENPFNKAKMFTYTDSSSNEDSFELAFEEAHISEDSEVFSIELCGDEYNETDKNNGQPEIIIHQLLEKVGKVKQSVKNLSSKVNLRKLLRAKDKNQHEREMNNEVKQLFSSK